MIKLETHCHSEYSFDSGLKIIDIADKCRREGINAIVICDHDVCGITEADESLFAVNGISLFRAIEFTTKEKAHIIGISKDIKQIEKPREYYSVRELIKTLKKDKATIIIPHPNHMTGIIGNPNVKEEDKDFALSQATYIEKNNYRYGETEKIDVLLKKYKNLRCVVGSDAHSQKHIGAFYNVINGCLNENIVIDQNADIGCKCKRKRNWLYWKTKEFKASGPYQLLLNLFPAEFRRKVKNKILRR